MTNHNEHDFWQTNRSIGAMRGEGHRPRKGDVEKGDEFRGVINDDPCYEQNL